MDDTWLTSHPTLKNEGAASLRITLFKPYVQRCREWAYLTAHTYNTSKKERKDGRKEERQASLPPPYVDQIQNRVQLDMTVHNPTHINGNQRNSFMRRAEKCSLKVKPLQSRFTRKKSKVQCVLSGQRARVLVSEKKMYDRTVVTKFRRSHERAMPLKQSLV